MIKNKKIVVTGGAGFIGSHLTEALAKENRVVVVDDLSTGRLENIQHVIDEYCVEFVKGCVTDLALLQKVFAGVDVVFHEAALASVPQSIQNPLKTHAVNAGGTLKVLLAARDNNVQKVVYASSCAVYGNPSPEDLPLKETAPLKPMSPYAVCKLAGEYYCNLFTGLYVLETVCLRYFNVYGPRQNPHGDYAAVIPKFIELSKKGEPLVIYGDGSQTRDFVYIDDVVSINLLATQRNGFIGMFNVGAGIETSISYLAESIVNIVGYTNDNVEYQLCRTGDILKSVSNNLKLNTIGYECFIDLKTGLEKLLEKKDNIYEVSF